MKINKNALLYDAMLTNVIIAIGNCKYKYSDNLLKSNDDAKTVYSIFTNQKALKCDKNKSVLVCDDDKVNTKNSILEVIDEKCKSIGKNEQLILYFSGHGADINSELNLMLYDSNRSTGDNCLSFSEIENIINSNNVGKAIIILDACFSGLAAKNMKSVARNTLIDLVNKLNGITVIASSKSIELSNEESPSNLSMFTHFLCDALNGDAESQSDGLLTTMTLYEYITKKIRQYGREIRITQVPAFKTSVEGLQIIGNYLFYDIDDKYVKDNSVKINVKSYKKLYEWLSNVEHTINEVQYTDIINLAYEIIINTFEHGKATKVNVTINTNSIKIRSDGDNYNQVKECKNSEHGLGVMLGKLENKYNGFLSVNYTDSDNSYCICINKEVVFLLKEQYVVHFGDIINEDILISPFTYKYYWFKEEPKCSAPSFRFKLERTVKFIIPKGSYALIPDPHEIKDYVIVEGLAEKEELFL
ncbi:MAG: caspase family protein [Acholeplasmatales bacterium]|nr:caspase family protein [Acholeplasmatales bacterium]